jgi:hypothetical protein
VADGVRHRALAVVFSHPRRVGHDALMGQRGGVHRIELGLAKIRLDHPFLEIVEYHVLAGAANVVPGLLVQTGPGRVGLTKQTRFSRRSDFVSHFSCLLYLIGCPTALGKPAISKPKTLLACCS